MSDTLLILHVKGTEAETTALPRHAVQAALSEGRITNSQLIWSPADNAWKQIRELPDFVPVEQLILHVKGTEGETKELPKRAIRAAISKGEITHSQLIWSAADNAWKQVRELPDLLPSQKLAPAPVRAVVVPQPRVVEAIIPESPTGPVARAAVAAGAAIPQARVARAATGVPRVRVAVEGPPKVRVVAEAAAASTPQVRVATIPTGVPQVRVAAAGTPQVRVAAATEGAPRVRAATPILVQTTGDLTVKEEDGFHPLKWLCIGLGVLILLVLGGNYLLVDQPLVSALGRTSYPNATVYGHFGAFIQPNVIVIHIPASPKITPDNLIDFLVALAHSTPENPIAHDFFARVALTSGWTAQYSFAGNSWKELGDMDKEDEAQRKEFIMSQLCDGSGQPLMPESTLSQDAQQARRDQVWAAFVAHFTAK